MSATEMASRQKYLDDLDKFLEKCQSDVTDMLDTLGWTPDHFIQVLLPYTHLASKIRTTFNIGIKGIFLYVNICWTPWMVLKPEPERVLTTPRGLADVSVSENHV